MDENTKSLDLSQIRCCIEFNRRKKLNVLTMTKAYWHKYVDYQNWLRKYKLFKLHFWKVVFLFCFLAVNVLV